MVGLVGSYLLERLLPGMCAYVVIECCCSGERSATISTFKRPVAGVRHHMIPQIWWLREGLGTMATLVGSKRERQTETGEEKNWAKLVFENIYRLLKLILLYLILWFGFSSHTLLNVGHDLDLSRWKSSETNIVCLLFWKRNQNS